MSLNIKLENNKIKSGLYLISTPIGNLQDITFRAIEILKNSDYILCEDTRVSKNLLNRYDINNKLISNHKFNEVKNLNRVIELLKLKKTISLISDAGTPTVSDPGKILINECVKNDIKIFPIPGPSAATTAISISGFSERFYFYGFVPEKKKILNEDFKNLSNLNCSIIFFISAMKLKKFSFEFKKYFNDRKIIICKEMTKIYEEFIRDDIKNIDISMLTLKGEFTVVISEKKNIKKSSQNLSESDKNKISKMINKFSIKEIVDLVYTDTKVSKKNIYNYCLKLKK